VFFKKRADTASLLVSYTVMETLRIPEDIFKVLGPGLGLNMQVLGLGLGLGT